MKTTSIRWGRWLIGGAALGGLALVSVVLLARDAAAPAASAPPATAPITAPIGTRLQATGTPALATQPANAVASATPLPLQDRAFGSLPLLAMPGDSGLGPRYTLTYERSATFDNLPAHADVYQLTWPRFTIDRVRDLAARLNLSGTISSVGPSAFEVSDTDGNRLFVAHGRILYTRGGQHPAQFTIDPTSADEQARRWLVSRGLLPANSGPVRRRVLDEAALVIVTFVPTTPQPLITPEPAVTITLDGEGEVRQLDILWPAAWEHSAYPLSTPAAAWEAIERGDAFVEVGATMPTGAEQQLTGHARLTQATLGYALAAGGDAEAAAYLEPVYVFTGAVQLDGQSTPMPLSIYVPALRDYPWPHG